MLIFFFSIKLDYEQSSFIELSLFCSKIRVEERKEERSSRER